MGSGGNTPTEIMMDEILKALEQAQTWEKTTEATIEQLYKAKESLGFMAQRVNEVIERIEKSHAAPCPPSATFGSPGRVL